MDESTLRSRQKKSSETSDQDKDPMLIKKRKQTSENYEFGDVQKIPTNIRDIMEKNFSRIFTWELYFGAIFVCIYEWRFTDLF